MPTDNRWINSILVASAAPLPALPWAAISQKLADPVVRPDTAASATGAKPSAANQAA